MNLTSKQRVLRALKHEPVDRTPKFYLGTESVNNALASRLGVHSSDEDALLEKLAVDVRFLMPIFLPAPGRKEYEYGSVHAVIHRENGFESIVMQKYPLEDMNCVEEILAYPGWPNPDWYDYKIQGERVRRLVDYAIVGYDMGIIFLYAMGMRGMEQIMVDMMESPDTAKAIFNKITDFHCERIRRYVSANSGVIDIVGIGDDVAGQDGLFFSIDMWREFIKPCVKRMAELCHELKVIPYFHGCGGFSNLYKDFIDIGISTTGRLQTEAHGNNFMELKQTYGHEMSFWGAVDGQHVCIEGTPDTVRKHVNDLLTANADNTGFVAGPTHSFTVDTPIENILAVYETLK